eukprot:5414525-Amphidinium_carterae.3
MMVVSPRLAARERSSVPEVDMFWPCVVWFPCDAACHCETAPLVLGILRSTLAGFGDDFLRVLQAPPAAAILCHLGVSKANKKGTTK